MNPLKRKSLYMLLSAVCFGIVSCDYISPPYSETAAAIVTKRKVLLEDFTGHKCQNCPPAALQADTIANHIFKGQVVVMALHVSDQFASPGPGAYYYDFRTPEGTEADNYFQIYNSGLPKGMINRRGFPNQTHKKTVSSWIGEVATELAEPAVAEIVITNSYNQLTNTVITSVKSKFIEDLTGKYFLNVFYVEDSIIQAQFFPGNVTDSNYVFNHVLRGSLNGTWGEQIALNPVIDDEVTKQYSTALKADAVPKNCRIVAFIYNDDNKEVIQAEEKELQ